MAFTDHEEGVPFDFAQQAQEKLQKIANIAEERDRVFTENEGKEVKIFGMGVGIVLAIYYFLIRR